MAGVLLALLGCWSSRPDVVRPEGTGDVIWLGGDVQLGDTRFEGRSALSALQAGGLAEFVAGAAGIVNLEGPVSGGPESASPGRDPEGGIGQEAGGDDTGTPAGLSRPRRVRLHNGVEALPALPAAGIRVAGIRNNHDRDGGSLSATASALATVGVLAAGEEGVRLPLGTGDALVLACEVASFQPGDIRRVLARETYGARWTVVTLHASTLSYLPDAATRAAVEEALDAGADVVAVHGSHRVGPVERRGSSFVAWGLGNLAMACDCTDVTEAVLVRVDLGRGEARVMPVQAGVHGRPLSAHPDPAAVFTLLGAIGSGPLGIMGDQAGF